MARTEKSFCVKSSLDVCSVIRGHHVYKSIWTPAKGEILKCRHDQRDEAKIFDDYAVGLYKTEEDGEQLVGHVPIELSFLFLKFIEKEGTELTAQVNGGRTLENGLVVPATYHIRGGHKLVSTFYNEMIKRKEGKAAHMKIELSKIKCGYFM